MLRVDQYGKVYLVGAGPGDPGLITVRGLRALAEADLVLYDYLVNPAVLQHARSGAEQMCLGMHGRTRIWPQIEINACMIQAAKAGKIVVRLKGGDPAIFGRGAEEAEALALEKVPFEIIPGVTAAGAAMAYAGIPLTHRNFASAVALVTGHEKEDEEPSAPLDYAQLAHFPGTLVVYMGVTTAERWVSQLVAGGKDPSTPTAIVRHCSLPDQQTITCSLAEVPQHLTDQRIRPPVVVIIGDVVRLAPKLSWYERLPLFGRRILITRPVHQAAELCDRFEQLGAHVLLQPAIEITPPSDWSAVDAAIPSACPASSGERPSTRAAAAAAPTVPIVEVQCQPRS
jgi:uroporphyrinogen III methyltransferase/synthase